MLTQGLVRGDLISIKGIAKILEKRYGTAPKLECLGSLEELRQHIDQVRPRATWVGMRCQSSSTSLELGIGQTHANFYQRFYIYYITNGLTALGDDLDNSRYPAIKPATVEDYIKTSDVRSM